MKTLQKLRAEAAELYKNDPQKDGLSALAFKEIEYYIGQLARLGHNLDLVDVAPAAASVAPKGTGATASSAPAPTKVA